KRDSDLRAEIVIAGLPEQGEPLSDALLERIQPRLVIVADSEFPATKRASPRLMERLGQQSSPVLYTRTAGAVTLQIGRDGWRLSTMNGGRLSSVELQSRISDAPNTNNPPPRETEAQR